jgi:hypothetical protein
VPSTIDWAMSRSLRWLFCDNLNISTGQKER